MSVHVSSWVWKNSKATGNELLLLLALADQSHDDGECWPGIKHLSARCRCSERTVQYSIQNLLKLGELEVIRRFTDNGHPSSNLYRIGGAEFAPYRCKDCTIPVQPAAPSLETLLESSSSPKEKKTRARARGCSALSEQPKKEEVTFFVTSLGMTTIDADGIWDNWLTNGFRTKTGPIKDWQACCRTWKRNGWFPSQKFHKEQPNKNGFNPDTYKPGSSLWGKGAQPINPDTYVPGRCL